MTPSVEETSPYYDSNGKLLAHDQYVRLFVGGPTQQSFHGPIRELSANYVAIRAEEDGTMRSSTNHANATIVHSG